MLYEMLTGDPPFQGSTAQAVLARILTEKPTSATQVRDSTPYHVSAAVDRALSKLPADRFASASQFVEALKRPGTAPTASAPAGSTAQAAPAKSRRSMPMVAGGLVAALAAGALLGRMLAPTPDPQVVRATLSFADDPELVAVGPNQGEAVTALVTPNGRSVIFVGATRTGNQLYRRDLESDAAEAIVGTEGAYEVEISPDGRNLVFFGGERAFMVPVTGGVARPIEGVLFGIDWAEDGYLYGTGTNSQDLVRVPADGGEVELLAQPDSGRQYYLPQLLPDRKHVLVAHTFPDWNIRDVGDAAERSMLRIVNMETKEVQDLVPGAMAFFAPPDLMVYAGAAGPTWARIDVETATLKGAARPFLPRAVGFDVSLSPSGHIVYVKGTSAGDQVVFVDGDGGEKGAVTDLDAVGLIDISPEGDRVVVSRGVPPDLWVHHLSGEAPIRLTFGDGEYDQPAWSGDGSHVYMTSGNGPASDLYRVRADGLGSPEVIRDEDVAVFYPSTTPGGEWVTFYELRPETQRDILALRQDSPSEVVEVVATPANERGPQLSPDERFMAYVSDVTGIDEVYVTRFPSGEGRWQVSSGGGWEAIWSVDGNRLFYRTATEYREAVVDPGEGFRVIRTQPLFSTDRFAINNHVPLWKVAPGGDGFYMVKTNPMPPELEIVLNAAIELTPER
jgi:serine/threonine-protein kinase